MIERIISIQNLGRFRAHQARGDIAMRRLTIIHGDNGCGKTTLCALFRSLMTGNTAPLLARKTLGQARNPSADILLSCRNVRLQNAAWSETSPELAIFDSEFVHQNVYSGDHVNRDHKRNSYRIIVGAQGVQLARQIDQLDADIRAANTEIRRLRERVQRHIPGDISVEDYLQIAEVADVDAQVQARETQVAAMARAVQQAVQIQSKGKLERLEMPCLPGGIAEVLAQAVPDVSQEAEARVREHIAEHLDAQGESWLAQGTGYASGQDCPFCGQDSGPSQLIGLYRSYFNDEYRRLKHDVASLRNRVNTALAGNTIADLARRIAANAEVMGFWRQFIDMGLVEIPVEQLQEAFLNAATSLEEVLAAKERTPLEGVRMPAQWNRIEAQVGAVRQAADAYNQRVAEINDEVERLKQAQPEHDINTAKAELQQLQLAKKRYELEVVADCDALTTVTTRKTQLEGQKETARNQLDQYCQAALQQHQDQINQYLEQFNTSFRVTNTRHDYVGGTPSSHFQIDINNMAVDLGDERTPEDMPCFKTALSAGDRSALALAFFLASLHRDPNLAQRIVVLDDPFSSQDRFRRASTQYLIAKLANEAAQVIVLSHDPHFLKAVAEEAPAIGLSRLQTSAVGDGVSITRCDIDAIIGCPLSRDRALLTAYVSHGEGMPVDVARAIRPVLEGHLRQAVPNGFSGMSMLGDMITAIRNSATDDALHSFDPIVDELDQINRYARAFHHPTGAQAPAPQIDGQELRGYAIRTLRLVGGY
jgi:wobble nucleotide-excising tRNase